MIFIIICASLILIFFSNKKRVVLDDAKLLELTSKELGEEVENKIEKYKKRRRSGVEKFEIGAILILAGYWGGVGLYFYDFWHSLILIILLPILLTCLCLYGSRLVIRGMQLMAPPADLTIYSSSKSPVLYLRCFLHDQNPTYKIQINNIMVWRNSSEIIFERTLNKIGPLIAIGNPNEILPTIGASRDYFSNDIWFNKIKEYVNLSQLLFVSIGFTDGIQKEIKEVLSKQETKKMIFYLPMKNLNGSKRINVDQLHNKIILNHYLWRDFFESFNINYNQKNLIQLQKEQVYQFLYSDTNYDLMFYEFKYPYSALCDLDMQQINLDKEFRNLLKIMQLVP